MKSIELTLTTGDKISLSLDSYSYAMQNGEGATVYLKYGIYLYGEVVTEFAVLESVTNINALINA